MFQAKKGDGRGKTAELRRKVRSDKELEQKARNNTLEVDLKVTN